MEDIIDDLRECIEQFLQFDDDETLAIFRDAILNNDNQELNETFDSFPKLVMISLLIKDHHVVIKNGLRKIVKNIKR